ncbi:MAG: ribosomal-processing cysteine protease Prp [Clostridiales bacterium]|jgi:uncharacterized protein YsxB (DUF464 family)|nr:ribosomal-processing cysteine protease Prp [Clostridiales bacterium]
MIKVTIERNEYNRISGFIIEDHAQSEVCSAVSSLAINAANSIEAFADEKSSCELREDGYISFSMPEVRKGKLNRDANLLMESLLLGLKSIRLEYPSQIRIREKRLQ